MLSVLLKYKEERDQRKSRHREVGRHRRCGGRRQELYGSLWLHNLEPRLPWLGAFLPVVGPLGYTLTSHNPILLRGKPTCLRPGRAPHPARTLE